MDEEEKLESLIVELRLVESYYNEVQARESIAMRAVVEARAALDALKALLPDHSSEILVPIGAGLFIRSMSLPVEKLIVNVGADVAVEKTKDEAIRFTEERLNELGQAVATLEAQKLELVKRIDTARLAISQIAERQQSRRGAS